LIGVTVVCVLCSIATYIGWEYVSSVFSSALASVGSYIGWTIPVAILVVAAFAGTIYTVHRLSQDYTVEFVRLLGAVIIGLMACWFVVVYDRTAYLRYQFDHSVSKPRMSNLCQFETDYNRCAFAVPVIGLALGCVFAWVWPRSKVMLEVVIQLLWLLALAWAALVLLIWEVQNIPVFSAMRWQY
jgi:hypothetical protein